ncbi:MAG TPA: hypothetical protein VH500_22515 [Nitrososphaeraceae archaeon]
MSQDSLYEYTQGYFGSRANYIWYQKVTINQTMNILFVLLFPSLLWILFMPFEQTGLTYVYSQVANNTTSGSGILDLFGKGVNNLNSQLGYSVTLDGNQIFPNSTLKDKIVNEYEGSTYNISSLKYNLLGYQITAHDIKLRVSPSAIDSTKTRIDIPIMLANNVTVTDGVNLKYDKVDLGSLWGVYDKTSDKIVVHIPIGLALKYLHL